MRKQNPGHQRRTRLEQMAAYWRYGAGTILAIWCQLHNQLLSAYMIELWRTRELAEQLRSNGLREKERLTYFAVFCIGFLPRIELGLLDLPLFPQSAHWAYLLAFLAIALWGSAVCFRQSSPEETVNFFERFICLAVPLSIKLMVFEALTRAAAFKITGAIWAADETHSFSALTPLAENEGVREVTLTLFVVSSVISLVFLWLFFARMKVHLAFSSTAQKAPNQ